MLDGYLERKLHAKSKAGSVPDSLADICFVTRCAIRFIPVLQIPIWLWIWPGVIVAGVASFAAVQEGHFIRTGQEEPSLFSFFS